MGNGQYKTVVLGPEWDEQLRKRVKSGLAKMGAKLTDHSSGLGGSQFVETFDFMVGAEKLRLEDETYEGLSVSGPTNLVDELVRIVGPYSKS